MSTSAISHSSRTFDQNSPQESFIQKWTHNDREINLVRRQNDLWFVVRESKTNRFLREDKIDTRGNSIETTIDLLMKCEVVTGQDNIAVPKRLNGCPEWPSPLQAKNFPNADVKLMRRDDELIWRIFDRNTKCARSITAHYTSDLQTYLHHIPTGAEEAYLKDFEVTLGFEGTNTEKIQSVFVSKLTAPSRLDPNVKLDRDNWAVTLINAGPCMPNYCYIPLDPGFGHAMIVYEGIEKGIPFIRHAHLTTHKVEESGYAVVRVSTEYGTKKPYMQSQTWRRTRDQAQRMEKEIERAAKNDKIPFNQFGTPWLSLESLKIFGWGVSEVALKEAQGDYGKIIDDPFIILCRPLSPSTSIGNWIRSKLDPTWNSPVEIEGIRFESAMEVYQQKMALYEFQRRKKRQEALDLIAQETAKFVAKFIQENCLTWAKKTVAFAGIELPSIDSFIAIPQLYIEEIAKNPSKVKLN